MLQHCILYTRGMTSFAKMVEIFLWQIQYLPSSLFSACMTHTVSICHASRQASLAIMIVSGNGSNFIACLVSHTCSAKAVFPTKISIVSFERLQNHI